TTVNAILNDANLMALNNAVQARMDANKTILKDACGLSNADFIDVPVLYEDSPYGGIDYGVALNPGVQNCIPVNDLLYVPDPEGNSRGAPRLGRMERRELHRALHGGDRARVPVSSGRRRQGEPPEGRRREPVQAPPPARPRVRARAQGSRPRRGRRDPRAVP